MTVHQPSDGGSAEPLTQTMNAGLKLAAQVSTSVTTVWISTVVAARNDIYT
jgi:hypothetical protein